MSDAPFQDSASIWRGSNPPSFEDLDQATNGILSKLAANGAPMEKYQARQASQPSAPSAGLAGLAPYLTAPGIGAAAAPLVTAAAPLALPVAAAYGIGKLVAPQQTDAAINWLKSKIAPAEAAGTSYEAGQAESLPGAQFLRKALPLKWQQALDQIKAQNPGANRFGQVTGTIGQFAIPGAAPLKGVTTLGKIGASTGNALLNAAPWAAGIGLNKYAQTGNVGQALGAAGMTEGSAGLLGGAAGGLGGLISEKFPGLLRTFKQGMENTVLREGLDIDPKAFKNVASFGGKLKGTAAQDNANTLREQLVSLANEAGITDKATREAWIATQGAKWKDVDKAWDASGKTVADFRDQIMQHPDIQALLQDNPNGQKIVDDLINGASQKGNIAGVRSYLQKPIDFTHKPGAAATMEDFDTADAAGAIRDTIDSAFVPPELKADYAKYKVLNEAITHRDLRLPAPPLTVGSQTAGRMIGSGIMGGIGGAMTGEGDTGKTLRRSVLGAALGSIGSRMGVSLANKGLGALSAKLAPMIPELAEREGGPVANALSTLGSRIAGVGAGAATLPVEDIPVSSGQPSQIPAQKASLPIQAPGGMGQETNNAQSPEKIIPEVAQSESGVPPQQQQAAKDQVNSAWSDVIKQRLSAIYDTQIAPMYGDMISRDDYFKQAQEMTNNFDPHLTAGFVFQDKAQALAYVKSYDTALKLQKMNLDKALQWQNYVGANPGTLLGRVESRITGRTEESQMALDNLKNVIVQHATPYGGKPDQATINQISKDVDSIASQRFASPAHKQQMLKNMLQEYGIDSMQLEKYGINITGGKPQVQNATA